jgi:hypothetical protein
MKSLVIRRGSTRLPQGTTLANYQACSSSPSWVKEMYPVNLTKQLSRDYGRLLIIPQGGRWKGVRSLRLEIPVLAFNASWVAEMPVTPIPKRGSLAA